MNLLTVRCIVNCFSSSPFNALFSPAQTRVHCKGVISPSEGTLYQSSLGSYQKNPVEYKQSGAEVG